MIRRWFTVKETAHYLGVHEKTIYRLTYKRAIPFAKVPGIGLRIDKIGLDELFGTTLVQPQDWVNRIKECYENGQK